MKRDHLKEASIIPLRGSIISPKKDIIELYESLSLIDELLNRANGPSKISTTLPLTKKENILQKMKKRFLQVFILLCLFFPGLVHAEDQVKKFEELRTLAESYSSKSMDTCMYYWEMAAELALDLDQQDNRLEAITSLATLHRMRGNYKEAEYYAEEGLKISQDVENQWALYNVLGHCAVKDDFVKADSIFQIALKLALAYKDSMNIGTTYNNIASINSFQGNQHLAADNYIIALKYQVHPFGKAKTSANICNVFMNLKNYKRAEDYILEAIKICDEHNYKFRNENVALMYADLLIHNKKLNQASEEIENALEYFLMKKDTASLATAFMMKAKLKLALKEFEKANDFIDRTLALENKSKDHEKCSHWLLKANILIKLKKYQQASVFLNRVLDLSQQHFLSEKKMTALDLQSRIYDQTGQTALAFQTYKAFEKLKDSLFQADQIKEINYLEASFNRNEQENKISLLDAKNSLSATRLSQQRKTIIIGAVSLGVVTLLSFFLFSFNRKIKSQNQIINKALSEKDILLREIHHRVKNNLQLVSSLLGLQGMTTQDQHIKEAINAGKSRVMSMALIHQDLYNKEKLTSVNVKEYLEKLCGELINTYQLPADQIRLETDIEELDLDVETLIPLGLIINELLTNALKYAFPNSQQGVINIKLFEKSNLLHLEVIDDGVGLSEKVASNSSFGFRMIKSLLRQLDGEMQSDGTNGTQFQFQFKDYKKAA